MKTNATSTLNPAIGKSSASGGLLVDLMICVGLTLLTLLVFKQTVGFDFVNFDDDVYIYQNSEVINGLTLRGIAAAFTQGSHANWDPLTTLSHMLDCQLYGLRPGGHHLTNVLLHTVSVLLLFKLLLQMTAARWQSAFAAAVFAIHPLRVESVAWVTERKDVLSGLFFMLTLGAYASYVRQPRRAWNYAFVLLFFVLGLMSKAMLVTVPLVLLLLDYWPLNRFGGGSADWRSARALLVEKIPLFVLALGACVVAVAAQGQEHAIQSLAEFPFSLRAANAVGSVVTYLGQMFLPAALAVYYPYPEHGLPVLRTAAALLVVLGITAAAWRLRRERPYLWMGWLWNLVMLAPVIGLLQLGQQAHADRYTYLPQIGLYVALSWLAGSLFTGWRSRRLFLALAGSAIIGALAVVCIRQTSYWRNSITLWEHCLAVTTDNTLAYYNCGLALAERGHPDLAVTQFEKALVLSPRDLDIRINLGSAMFQSGQFDEAIAQLN
ncbi:MAG TPA: tetratricopeptide repeat protein, partial [Candidatus Angelobacter sp.]|nr:tetratricopeptide repeat protein [Candidatus Angelobacter sp.]